MPEDARGATLLAIARQAIQSAEPVASARREPWLLDPGATFVTLKLDGELRGCIGSLEPRRPLGEDVEYNARAAAYRDPRFPPVTPEERERLEVEVSVLSRREPVVVASEAELLRALRPGVDGIYLEYGHLGSTFLPQVWESLPDPALFMAELKRKAGLPATFWHGDVKVSRYTVEKFQ